MSVGRVLTLGLGSFSEVGFLVTLGYGTAGAPPPAPAQTDVIRNFSKRKKKDDSYSLDNWREWVKEERPEVVEAVKEAAAVEVKVASGEAPKKDLKVAKKAKAAYLQIYREELKQAFLEIEAEELERQWAEDVARYKKQLRRRAAVMLLLS